MAKPRGKHISRDCESVSVCNVGPIEVAGLRVVLMTSMEMTG